jgi:Icc-related predicted phosphoesterase
MGKHKITLISDTHQKHNQLRNDLPGGDILIHAGDFMSSGYYKTEAIEFFNWFEAINNYDTKVFIAGNHDRIMEDEPEWAKGTLTGYKTIEYLQDEGMGVIVGDEPEIKLYGSPWQPEFCNWVFNLPRNGEEIKVRWDAIPDNTDILITHGPAWGHLDFVRYNRINVGCEMLRQRIDEIRPKIHVCGHIHQGYGYYFDGHTHFFNAAVLNEQYMYANLPFNFEWDNITNEITWI